MRVQTAILSGLSGLALVAAFPTAVFAGEGDISEALRFAEEIMGEEIVEGYEEFVDDDPDEALSLILSRDVVPGRAPEAYLEDDGGFGIARGANADVLESLGDSRLNYVALKDFIAEAAAETKLPAGLIDAVIRTESGYRPRAISRKGAIGLMQLMPATAKSVGVRDPFDPRENILGGARYLKRMFDQFGSVRLAVAAYNAGPGAVAKHGGVPPFLETMRYVNTVLGRFQNARFVK